MDQTTAAPSSDTAVTPSAPASSPAETTGSPVSHWLRSLVGRGSLSVTATDSGQRAEETPASDTPPTDTPKDAPKVLTLTEDEKERLIQAETDRREAKRQAKDAEIRRKEENKRLYEQDTLNYADRKRQEELAAEQATEFYSNQQKLTRELDSFVDPVFHKLDEPTRQAILSELSSVSDGIEHRKAVIEKSLEKLLAKARAEGAAEADARLRTNPAHRKQILAVAREQADEPDVVPAAGSSSNGHHRNINDQIRSRFR